MCVFSVWWLGFRYPYQFCSVPFQMSALPFSFRFLLYLSYMLHALIETNLAHHVENEKEWNTRKDIMRLWHGRKRIVLCILDIAIIIESFVTMGYLNTMMITMWMLLSVYGDVMISIANEYEWNANHWSICIPPVCSLHRNICSRLHRDMQFCLFVWKDTANSMAA